MRIIQSKYFYYDAGMDFHRAIILSVLSRCTVSSIRETLTRWGRLNSAELNNELFRGSKREVSERVIQLVQKDDLNDDIIGDLELAYMQLHSRSKIWLVYMLVGNCVSLNLDPRTLRSKVLHSLQLKWKHGRVFGNMRLFTGAVWLRMNLSQSLPQGKSRKKPPVYNHNNSVFVITFPGSPYVFINKTGIRLFQVVTEALLEALNADDLKDMKLSGRHVSSLADLVLSKDNKILLRKYQDQEEIENPLLVRQDRKRKAFEDDFCDTEMMVDENRWEKCKRKVILENKFGSDPQHVLEKLEYKFSVKFHGTPDSNEMCKSSVEIKGKSVLDGLCQLAAKGLVKFPLPRHLTTVIKSARNSFTVESVNKK